MVDEQGINLAKDQVKMRRVSGLRISTFCCLCYRAEAAEEGPWKVVQQARPARRAVHTAVTGKQLHQKWATEELWNTTGRVRGFEVG